MTSGEFDAIFCMAVLQDVANRNNQRNQTATGITFAGFEKEILMLNSKLKTGGLFIIDNSDFSFPDTECANLYKPLDFPGNRIVRSRPLFNTHNIKISERQDGYRVFVKK